MQYADPHVHCLGESGFATAKLVAERLDALLVLPIGLHPEEDQAARSDFSMAVRECFASGIPVVGVCAAGILIRLLAPCLKDKTSEPPVVCVSEDGRSVIPLLGGHSGGNELARNISAAISAHAAITTASDLKIGAALDQPPPGWRLENPEDCKEAAAGLLSGRPAALCGDAEWLAPLHSLPGVELRKAQDEATLCVLQVNGCRPLVYRRVNLAVGVGASRNCPAEELIGLVRRALAEDGLSEFEVEAVYSVDVKSDEAAVHALARDLGVEARFFSPEALELETWRLVHPSEQVFNEVGCHGVCEAAALSAAGPNGRLLVPKFKSANATVAIAGLGLPRGGTGSRRGRLSLIGLGPGALEFRSYQASRLLAEAEHIVGYRKYLELVGPVARTRELHPFDLGREEERCRFALELAGEGKSVALVCSGDSGIYAMGALVMEMLARGDGHGGVSAAARRVAVVSAAGITAMQAASARAGAVLGHDFCAISLSDLMTSRDVILARVEAAADGDFVVAFYNPASARRRELLTSARDILLRSRPASTPVIIARNVGREGEELHVIRLDELCPDQADMMTVVLIGNRETKAFALGDSAAAADGVRVFTPRGYAQSGDDCE